VYRRFAWDNPSIQKHFPMNTRDTMMGPGFYSGAADGLDAKANERKGVFKRTGRTAPENRNPGPGAYKNTDPNAIGQRTEDAFCIPRGERKPPFVGRPDYDMSAFYKMKQGNKKHIQPGYTFKDTTLHVPEDPSKKLFPGPAFYNEEKAAKATTQYRPSESYTVPIAGSMDLDKIMRYFK
jgi:hypothetical protein